MKQYSPLELLKMNKLQLFGYKLGCFFAAIPAFFKNLGIAIGKAFKKFGIAVYNKIKDIIMTFVNGDWKTRLSFLIFGFGLIARGQIGRGLLFLLAEVAFIIYMIMVGGQYISKFGSLGTEEHFNEDGILVNSDNSFRILLYGILTIFFIVAIIYTWVLQIKQNKIAQQIKEDNKKLATVKDDVRAMVDKEFHKTLLTLPIVGIIFFTIMPIIFMILVAFTNYNGSLHDGVNNGLFGWVGFETFGRILNWSNSSGANFSATFGEILVWTLIWAFFATFTNYFLGMAVAMLINKKGIKFKKFWRTVLVLSIAIPQFISLLYVKTLFDIDGPINEIVKFFGGNPIHFLDNEAAPWTARITVILINVWVGIPYLMLIVTGILMNIPADLYESANIDGANVWQQYTRITLPYMLFVTGPYLLTSFTGNMNNFNIIYLLTGGAPQPQSMVSSKAGQTDLLITWLFNLAISGNDYALGSVIGIMVFIVVAVISLIVYNVIPSVKNEEEFQ